MAAGAMSPPSQQFWVCLWRILILYMGPVQQQEALVRAPPRVPPVTNITSTTGLTLPKPPTDIPTHKGPSGWRCSQQQERWLGTGCARSGGGQSCDRQLGHSLAEDKSHSSHSASGMELRQNATTGTILPMHRWRQPHNVEQHRGHGMDWEMTVKTSSMGPIWGPCSPSPGCGWGLRHGQAAFFLPAASGRAFAMTCLCQVPAGQRCR